MHVMLVFFLHIFLDKCVITTLKEPQLPFIYQREHYNEPV